LRRGRKERKEGTNPGLYLRSLLKSIKVDGYSIQDPNDSEDDEE
jgi:hypothetical protein